MTFTTNPAHSYARDEQLTLLSLFELVVPIC